MGAVRIFKITSLLFRFNSPHNQKVICELVVQISNEHKENYAKEEIKSKLSPHCVCMLSSCCNHTELGL